MKKWLLLICVSVSLTSCSYLTNFYIFNTSETAITITYKTKKTELYHPFVTAPKVFSFKNLKNIRDAEIENTVIQQIDSLTVIATLQPKQALWIGVDKNFILKNKRQLLAENLDYLEIMNALETKQYTPKEIAAQFQEFTYKIVGIAIE